MKFVILIPAREGSKRLPHKNYVSLNDKPLIYHSIDYALSENDTIPIYISTDDPYIIDICKNKNVHIINRPKHISCDHSTTGEVMAHATKEIISSGYDFDYIILLQCTQPLRPMGIINECIKIINETKVDSLLSVSSSLKKFGKIIDNKFIPWNYTFGQRSQDMVPLYFENGLIYITNRALAEKGVVISDNAYPFKLDHPFANIDIDTQEDLDLAEFFSNKYKDQ